MPGHPWSCADSVLPARHRFGVPVPVSQCESFLPKENGVSPRAPGRGLHPETGGWAILGITRSGISKFRTEAFSDSIRIGIASDGLWRVITIDPTLTLNTRARNMCI